MSMEQAAIVAMESLNSRLNHEAVVRIDYDYLQPGILSVVIHDDSAHQSVAALLPRSVDASDENSVPHTFTIRIVEGPKIRPLVGDIDDIPRNLMPPGKLQGGDPCYIEGERFWGTIGLFAALIDFDVQDRIGNHYKIRAENAFMTNNHVIADLDRRAVGTPLRVGEYPSQSGIRGHLAGFLPLSNLLLHIDFAVGNELDAPFKRFYPGMLRGIGMVSKVFRNPVEAGERIRKSGAKTFFTEGATTGRTSIRAPGTAGTIRWYNGVYKTNPGFSDHGDSGSIIVGENNDIVGMVTWGDDHNKPAVGYFWTFGSQWPFSGISQTYIGDFRALSA